MWQTWRISFAIIRSFSKFTRPSTSESFPRWMNVRSFLTMGKNGICIQHSRRQWTFINKHHHNKYVYELQGSNVPLELTHYKSFPRQTFQPISWLNSSQPITITLTYVQIKLKPGLEAFYAIWPWNRSGIFNSSHGLHKAIRLRKIVCTR